MLSIQKIKTPAEIADLQQNPDKRGISIQKVGIKSLAYPIKVRQENGQILSTIGTFNLFVSLPADKRGAHMSRFIELLNGKDWVLNLVTVQDMLKLMNAHLESETAFMDVSFTYFRNKAAPATGVKSFLDYQVELNGSYGPEEQETRMKVLVPVTSLCPCSKEISNYGAHNQRSHVEVTIKSASDISIEKIIDIVESQASAELYTLLKRQDEKLVTEKAYDNPKFVEDMVRDIALQLSLDPSITAYRITCENFESIHNHSAYAEIESGF